MPLRDHIPEQVLEELRANPGRFVKVVDPLTGRSVGMMGVVSEEGRRRGQANGVRIEEQDGRTHAVVEADGIRETIHLSDYGYNRKDVEELNRLLTRGRVRRVAGPAPHQVASGLFVPKG